MKTEQDDLTFMQNEKLWPMPILPVKRYTGARSGGLPECGIVLPNSPVVIMANMYQSRDEILASAKQSYPDFQAMIADGWMVD